jgi:hypothetical protein
VTHDPLFDSAWLKWAQAVHHTQTLEAKVKARSGNGHFDPLRAFRAEYYPKRHGFGIIPEMVDPIPVGWNLLLGDIANNYRTALDHLAWALVTRGSTPPKTGKLTAPQEKAVYFPICEKRSEFDGMLPTKLPGVRSADIAKVRRPQPYHYSARSRPKHVFVLLASVNTGDKHRTIQPIWAHPIGLNIELTDQRDCVVPRLNWRRYPYPVEVGTELAYIPARKMGSNPEIDVELRVTTNPSLGDLLGLEEWALRIANTIAKLLFRFSEPPNEIVQIADLARLATSQEAIGLRLS